LQAETIKTKTKHDTTSMYDAIIVWCFLVKGISNKHEKAHVCHYSLFCSSFL